MQSAVIALRLRAVSIAWRARRRDSADHVVQCPGDRGDRDRVDANDLGLGEVGVVDDAAVAAGSADPVVGRDRHVDVCRVDVAQLVDQQPRVV